MKSTLAAVALLLITACGTVVDVTTDGGGGIDGGADAASDAGGPPDSFIPPNCGDSNIDTPEEECDDGNRVTEPCDYGDVSCTVCDETCHYGPGITSYCGNSSVDVDHEGCDDGNATTEACAYGQTSCTVCDDTCHDQAGATSYCGDSATDGSYENCDDGNAVTESCTYGQTSCTVCNSTCHTAAGATSYCGNGSIDPAHEQCDGTSCSGSFYCSTCECIMSGTLVMSASHGYDFSAGGTSGGVSFGDFYLASAVDKFYANNFGMEGLVDMGAYAGTLQSVTVPTSGYYRFGVNTVLNHVYVSKAVTSEPNYYIIFKVTGLTTTVTISWIYVYRP